VLEAPGVAIKYVPYEGPIVTRDQARASGATRYFTGKPCKHGHLGQRTTCNGGCIWCNQASIAALYYGEGRAGRKYRNARRKAWKDANREKVRVGSRIYDNAHREQKTAWKVANRDRINQLEREANRQNRAAYKARIDRYLASKGKATQQAYIRAHPEIIRAIKRNRRARLANAKGSHTAAEIKVLYAEQSGRCAYCDVPLTKSYAADHIVPLSRGGSNWISNIALACKSCNSRKHAMDEAEFLRRLTPTPGAITMSEHGKPEGTPGRGPPEVKPEGGRGPDDDGPPGQNKPRPDQTLPEPETPAPEEPAA
jgi:5-methylcytosine-specific restriction endonuclease McrA